MTQYTPEEYISLLNRTYIPRFPRDNRPRILRDVDEKEQDTVELILPHPEDGCLSVSLTAYCDKGLISHCSLRFGQADVAVSLEPEEALDAIEEILSDRIVAIVRYKNEEAYDNHRKISTAPTEWLYQMPDHEEALAAMIEELERPASLFDKITGKKVGVFEVYRWSERYLIRR